MTGLHAGAAQDQAYFAVLTADAIFMPPNSVATAGEQLRGWPSSFVRDFEVEWLSVASAELALACETMSRRMKP